MSLYSQSDAVGWAYSTSTVCAIIEVGRYLDRMLSLGAQKFSVSFSYEMLSDCKES